MNANAVIYSGGEVKVPNTWSGPGTPEMPVTNCLNPGIQVPQTLVL
jgi:hypothetical protein